VYRPHCVGRQQQQQQQHSASLQLLSVAAFLSISSAAGASLL